MTENDLANENGITQTWAERLLNIVLCRGDLANEKLEARPVAVTELFRYGSRLDYIYVIIGSILAALIGVVVPLTCVLTGFICNIYLKENKQIGNDELWKHAMWLCLGFGLVGVLLLVLCYLQYYFLYTASNNVVKNLRKEFVKAVLKQEAIWFDQKHAGTITTQLNENIARIQDGIGDKIGLIARGISIFLSSVIYSLILEWKMTLIMIGVGPASAMTMGLMAKLSANSIKRLIEISGDAGATTEESIMNVKTVATCNGQKQMVEKYSSKLASGLIWAIRYSFINGFCEGIMYLLLYAFYSLGLIYGIPCYYDGIIHDPGIIFITTSCILIGSYFLGLLGPHMMAILKARVAAAVIYQTIDKETKADSQPFNDEQILQCNGRIEFRDVHFKYPTRESPILQGLSWSASPGETVAFVGKSGCGKSTSIGLLTRFYEADQGSMMIDGKEIRSINLQNLRRMIGIVQQEPCLFNGTIRENIILGRNISHEQSEEAAKIANAHDFIMKLENGYNTLLGTGGVTLSGGQKQRIAIARAVATSPRILLLDEATSALDSESEKIVQLALNKASRGRTTVVIAHRLSTLRDVQRIYVIDQGKVAETGTHFELLKKDGLYSNLAKAQEIGIETERKRMISISSDVSRNIDPLKRFDMRSSGVGRRSLTSSVVSEPIPRHYEKDQKDSNKSFRLDNGLLRIYLSSLGFRPAIYICFFCSVLRGLELPFCAFFQGVTFQALDQTPETYSPFMWKAVGFYLILAVYCWIFLATSIGFGGWASESVTTDLRVKVFRNLLHQNASFFDNPNTSNASCVTILTTQASDIQACFDYRFMLMVNNIVSVIVCFILAMVSSWSIALVMAGLILLFISLTWFISDKVSKTMEEKSKQDTSAEFAVEIFEQARTIQVLAVEEHFVDIYERLQNISKRCDNMIGILQAMQFALTQSYIYFSDMLTYGVGAYMIYYGYLLAVDVIVAATCANFAGWSVIFASATFADFTRANSSAKSLFSFMKKDSPIEALLEGEKPDIIGSVKVENVSFSYPSRPDVKIARSLNLQAHKGEAIALVGVSGCGKSTIIQLLERFYAPTSGSIKIDNSNVSKISLHHLRSNIALVGQEPVLFKGSILENITLGLENISLVEIRKACKLANAANFIEAFPLSYETNVGEKGKNLSGGQKQRIAIARALIRNPKIILLDEATSALDTESEKMVQAALNEASLGRTSITIAHRLSTISGADRIYYVEDGSVVEFGTHEELIEADGKYAKLVRAQMLVNNE